MDNMVQNRFVMIVLAVVIIDSQYGRKIGNPSYIEDGPSAKVEAGGDAADGTQYTQPLPLRQAKRQRTECCVHPGLMRELPVDVVVSIWKLVGGGSDSLALLKDDHDRAHVAKALVGKHRLLLLAGHPEMESVVQNLRGSKEELDLYCMRLHQLANTGMSVGAIAAIRCVYAARPPCRYSLEKVEGAFSGGGGRRHCFFCCSFLELTMEKRSKRRLTQQGGRQGHRRSVGPHGSEEQDGNGHPSGLLSSDQGRRANTNMPSNLHDAAVRQTRGSGGRRTSSAAAADTIGQQPTQPSSNNNGVSIATPRRVARSSSSGSSSGINALVCLKKPAEAIENYSVDFPSCLCPMNRTPPLLLPLPIPPVKERGLLTVCYFLVPQTLPSLLAVIPIMMGAELHGGVSLVRKEAKRCVWRAGPAHPFLYVCIFMNMRIQYHSSNKCTSSAPLIPHAAGIPGQARARPGPARPARSEPPLLLE